MRPQDTALAYRQSNAFATSAVGQVVALYDGILRDLYRALSAMEAAQIENRVNAMNHALIIISELQGVLDFDRGGTPARHLNSFYKVTRAMITEASVSNSLELTRELISMFTRLRAAWAHVERTVAPSEPTQMMRISSQPRPPVRQNISNPPEHSSGTGGGWRA
jgi:flagellar protein FliS